MMYFKSLPVGVLVSYCGKENLMKDEFTELVKELEELHGESILLTIMDYLQSLGTLDS